MSQYPSNSPYGTTPSAGWHVGLYKHRAIPVDATDREVTITQKYHGKPDLLSYDLYGTPVYWWVFLSRNMNIIRDPIWDLEEGKKIMVPTLAHLRSVAG